MNWKPSANIEIICGKYLKVTNENQTELILSKSVFVSIWPWKRFFFSLGLIVRIKHETHAFHVEMSWSEARGWSGWNQSSAILRNFASFIEFYRVSVSFSEL